MWLYFVINIINVFCRRTKINPLWNQIVVAGCHEGKKYDRIFMARMFFPCIKPSNDFLMFVVSLATWTDLVLLTKRQVLLQDMVPI